MTTGQSANCMTGLPGVLGVTAGVDVLTFGAPKALVNRLQSECPGVKIESKPLAGVYSSRPSLFIGGFCFLSSELTRALPAFKRLLADGGTLWVFWPGPAAWHAEGIRPEMGITEEVVRASAQSLGLFVNGGCELDDQWSGLKLDHLAH